MMRLFRLVALTVIGMLTMTNCSGSEDTMLMPTYESTGGGEAAALVGRLERVDTCAQVSGYLLVFPASNSARWDGDTLTAGAQSWTLGDRVEIGGGGTTSSTVPTNVTVPSGCSAGKYWYVNVDAVVPS